MDLIGKLNFRVLAPVWGDYPPLIPLIGTLGLPLGRINTFNCCNGVDV